MADAGKNKITMITNETELKEATKKLEAMGDKLNDASSEKDIEEFEKLSKEIEAYENIHYPIGKK